ncbi:hypothetical protein EYF80_039388 [Liparis tanakae]|uniref:Uncharacterized protein n=1 Tax=Liparis tanakae TaxID=230148 RepID=A0A4Z2GB28_9TELE|nr:hypothetical protein EYF80_039388 [Liparis tanakae]
MSLPVSLTITSFQILLPISLVQLPSPVLSAASGHAPLVSLIPFTWSSRPSHLLLIPSLVPVYSGPLTCAPPLPHCSVPHCVFYLCVLRETRRQSLALSSTWYPGERAEAWGREPGRGGTAWRTKRHRCAGPNNLTSLSARRPGGPDAGPRISHQARRASGHEACVCLCGCFIIRRRICLYAAYISDLRTPKRVCACAELVFFFLL